MGIFSKIFGDKPVDPRNDSPKPAEPISPIAPVPSASPSNAPLPTAPIPPRRERVKPKIEDDSLVREALKHPLLEVIHDVVREDTPANRTRIYEEFLKTQFYLLVANPEGLPTGEVTLQPGQELQLATIQDPNGQVFLPLFTDLARVQNSIPDKMRYLLMPAPSVLNLFLQGPGAGIIINPNQPPSGVLVRAECEILASGQIPQFDANGQLANAPPAEMQLAIRKPATNPPEGFVRAVRDICQSIAEIKTAHVVEGAVGNDAPKLLLAIWLDDGLPEPRLHEIFRLVGEAASKERGDMDGFNLMPVDEGFVTGVEPLGCEVYRR
jgi:hypothetical protein